MSATIDLNCDLGEGFGRWRLTDDHALLGVVTSANVACGFHAGDPTTMREMCEGAARSDVVIGAQVSYPDLQGFGRRFIDMAPSELADCVVYQIAALDGVARVAGTCVRYVKPHGALYHAVIDHEGQARAVVEAVAAFDPRLMVLGAPASALLAEASRRSMDVVVEGFVDRRYRSDGRLVPRSEPHSSIDVVEDAVRQALDLALHGRVRSIDGAWVRVPARSLCVHSDTPGAVALASDVRRALHDAGVDLASFCAV